jgi:hypothetical protein
MSGLLRIRNKLVFPGGRAPGFDPTQIAAASTTPLLSAVTGRNGNFINAQSGVAGAVTGAPAFGLDSYIGPALAFTSTARTAFASSLTTAANLGVTFGVICSTPSSFAANAAFFEDPTGYIPGAASGTIFLSFDTGGGTDINFGITLSVSTPYFIAMTANNAVSYAYVVNLRTGKTVSVTKGANTTPSAGTQFCIGNYHGGTLPWGGKIAAIAWMRGLMGLPALEAWAADPWSYWYPPRVENIILTSLRKPSSTSASVNLSSVAATGAVVALKPSISRALTAVASTGAAEGFKPTDQRVIAAAAATGAVEALKPSVSKTLGAVSATSAVEALSRTQQRSLTGVAATSVIEVLKPSLSKVLGTAAAAGAAEALGPKVSIALAGAVATAAVGSLTRATVRALAAAAATGSVGTLLSSIDVGMGMATVIGAAEAFTIPTPPVPGGAANPPTNFRFGHMGHRR